MVRVVLKKNYFIFSSEYHVVSSKFLLSSSFFFPQVATDVIKEFAADGVKYLELRSTPREEKNTGKDVNVEVHILIARFIIKTV